MGKWDGRKKGKKRVSEFENLLLSESKKCHDTYAEVISYNKKNLERELQNESRQQNRQQGRVKRREEEI